ncbi:MAG TPA: CPBP family intramembrane glutamic endopeptidase [Hyphomicrobiaceae bacterium]|jgi:membrane protease YdiL (CAAX protease family)|nr:CPBP family intramembrane glutamic endopeptidase [Hyphomicrobiaceae bacterium]
MSAGSVQPASGAWGPLLAGLVMVFGLFQWLAHALGSDRGEAGLLIAAAVIVALVAVEGLLFRLPPMVAVRSLGFGPPTTPGLIVAMGLGLLLLATIPVYAVLRGASVVATPGWMWLLPGLLAQGGVAEEALFRGYLFRHLRRERPFWRAAGLSAVPFALVHLYLFATLPWPIALASILLATVISFPLAHLFELGGNTIWPPALLHFIVQAAVKVSEVPGDTTMPLIWIAASAALPYLAFLYRRPSITAAPA